MSFTEQIAAAFPGTMGYQGDQWGTWPEAGDYASDFGSYRWQEVPDDILDLHTDMFCLMSDEALRYYLPAALSYATRDPLSTSADYFVFFVCSDRFSKFVERLTQPQTELCFTVVQAILAADPSGRPEDWEALAVRAKACRPKSTERSSARMY